MKLKAWFNNRPVHTKLTLINVIVVLAALLPIICMTLVSEFYAVRQAAVREAEVQADIIRDNASAAMAFGDAASAREILHTLSAAPDILGADLLTPDGRSFVHYKHEAGSQSHAGPVGASDHSQVDWSSIRVFRKVYLKQQWVGDLVVETSLKSLYDRLRLYLLINVISTAIGFAIAYPLSLHLKESITAPLADLMNLAQHVTRHQDYGSARAVSKRDDEIGSLSRAFDNMLTNIHERDLKLSQMAYYDNVTGLTNRHYFMERVEQAVGNALRYGSRTCLMFIDLDDFKLVNDTHGHDVGDMLLREVAARLTGILRDSDVLSRLGGDEFAVITENVRDAKGPEVLAQKMIASLSSPMELNGCAIVIGASIGIALCPEHASNVAGLMKSADTAMYRAKEQGKNRYCLHA